MKTGIYGGSFDPPHLGHVLLLHSLLLTQDLDRVLVMPTADHPEKQHLTPIGHRTAMCWDAFDKLRHPDVHVSALENRLKKPSYTKRTLEFFKKEYPDDDLFYIIGSDLVEEIPDWKHAEGITDLATFMIVPRQGYPISDTPPAILGDFISVNFGFQLPEISSTHIKKMIKRGAGIEGYLPRSVIEYIEEHGLYS